MSYDEHLISMAGGDGDTTADQLAAIEARARAATEGPWEIVSASLHQPIIYADSSGLDIAIMDNRDGVDNDAEFIAHARTDVPALLALVREQQAKLDRVEALADEADAIAKRRRDLWHVAPSDIRAAITATEEGK